MSYSRWSNSFWYTFWCVSNATKKEDEVFEVCSMTSFTYRELKKDMNACIKKIKQDVKDEIKPEYWKEADYKELRGYMKEFIKDVDEDYKNKK